MRIKHKCLKEHSLATENVPLPQHFKPGEDSLLILIAMAFSEILLGILEFIWKSLKLDKNKLVPDFLLAACLLSKKLVLTTVHVFFLKCKFAKGYRRELQDSCIYTTERLYWWACCHASETREILGGDAKPHKIICPHHLSIKQENQKNTQSNYKHYDYNKRQET